MQVVQGLHKLQGALQAHGIAEVQDIETSETFKVHIVEGQIVVLATPQDAIAETQAAVAIARAAGRAQ